MNIQPIALIRKLFDAEETGQALAEYGLILALIFVACIAALVLLGGSIVAPINSFVDAVGGASGS